MDDKIFISFFSTDLLISDLLISIPQQYSAI
jgi:hypothetical protein